ncbi:hypothetical protein Vadar_005774 [Vaccinium darrowii]|uniref:Uncharacterized protein n=1 Tax=Vaccinium darrowii TaxID=229202 RepID=A0ACB7XPM2_9ERIC|nr:hypothetical protein Vadar_005774 [Vaccinium darrowii]
MAETLLLHGAQAILGGLMPLVTQPITQQISLARGFEKDLTKLQTRLENIQDLLRDAENRQIATVTLKKLLKRLKSVACDLENVLAVCTIYGTSGDDGRTAVVAAREIIPLKKKNFRRQYARFLEFTASFSASAVVCSEGCQLESSFVKVACEDFGPGEYCIIADSGQSNLDLITLCNFRLPSLANVNNLFTKLIDISHPAVLFTGPPVTMEEQWLQPHMK